MLNFDFTEASFTLTGCRGYNLSLFCGFDGFTILVHDDPSGEILLCRHYPFRASGYQILLRKVRELVSGNDLLKQPFGKTTIYLGERNLSLIPENLWSARMAESLFPPLKKYDTLLETLSVPVQQPEAFLVFRTGREFYEYLTLTFPGAGITHEIIPFFRQRNAPRASLRFYLHDSWFYAVSEDVNQVSFVNSFDYKSETDMVYFMLTVNREFNTENHPVFLSGWLFPDDPRISLIRKHLPGIVWQGESDGMSGNAFTPAFRSFYAIFRK